MGKPHPDLGEPASGGAAPAIRADQFGPGREPMGGSEQLHFALWQSTRRCLSQPEPYHRACGRPAEQFRSSRGFCLGFRQPTNLWYAGERESSSIKASVATASSTPWSKGNPLYSATLDYNAFNNQSLANPFPALPVLGTFSSRYANFAPACQTNPATNFSVCNSEPQHSVPGRGSPHPADPAVQPGYSV